jgi:hypothetical protein
MSTTERRMHSRRSLLAAGLGGAAVLAADASIHPFGARAATGDPLILGTANVTPDFTTLTCTQPGAQALTVWTSGGGVSIRGQAEAGEAVVGLAETGTGVLGGSGGDSPTAYGVAGSADRGVGVYGASGRGIAVQAEAYGGTALDVLGPRRFDTAYLVTIPRGRVSTTFAPRMGYDEVPLPLTPQTKVLCTLMTDPGPRRIRFAKVDPAGGTITVHLDAIALGPLDIACFVLS